MWASIHQAAGHSKIFKIPLLGMAAAWDSSNAKQEDGHFNTSQLAESKKNG